MREAGPLVNLLRLREQKEDDRVRIFSRDAATLVITGIGSDAAARVLRDTMARRSPALVVNAGLCAAVRDHLAVGSCLEAGCTAMDCCGGPAMPLAAPPDVHSTLLTVLLPVEPGVQLPPAARDFDLLDMEAAALALVCRESGTPLRVFKVVSDFAGSGNRRDIIKNTPALMQPLAEMIQREFF